MRINRIEDLSPDKTEFALILECTNCSKKWKAIGANDADYIYREVFELRCPACGHQDQPASPCPHCDEAKPGLRVVERVL